MDVKQLYGYVLDQTMAVGVQVDGADLPKPTPDSDWSVRDLMQHMLTELVWIPDIMAGKTTYEVGETHRGDLLGTDMQISWRTAVDAARSAVQAADMLATAHLSYTDKPVGEYLLESADDLLVHAWDLGQAIGVSVVFDEAVGQVLYDHMQTLVDGVDGLFGERRDVAESAPVQTKLLALLGRSEDWAKRT